MISLIDGPGSGVRLACVRCPVYLRVCCCRDTGKWDACDLLTDCPAVMEIVYVYELVEAPASAFVCTRGEGGGGGPQQIGRYRLCAEQPSPDVVRSNRKWAAWCQDPERKLPEWVRAVTSSRPPGHSEIGSGT